jgi:hypothetical protein
VVVGMVKDHVTSTPFHRNGKVVVKLGEEHARSRRLDDGEEQKLLAVSGPNLSAIVIAAIETGMRRGEILTLQNAGRKRRGHMASEGIHLPAA